MKTTATRTRSERFRNKQAGDEEAEKQKKAAVSVLSLAIRGQSKKRFSAQIVRLA